MADVLVIGLVLLIVGSAAAYLVRAKKRGVKCIGCPSGCCCTKDGDSACGCSHSPAEGESIR